MKHLSLRVSPLGILPGKATNYNLSKEEYLTMCSLQNDRSVVIKPTDKGYAVVVWDRSDYLKEASLNTSLNTYL